MSMRYKGGVISATPPTTSTSAATGVWTLVQQMQAQGAGAWPVQPGPFWIGLLGGADGDYGRSVAVDSNGNVYLCGQSYASGSYDIQIAKYNTAGAIQWQRSLSGAVDVGWSIAVDSSSNIYVCGYSNTPPNGSYRFQIAKYNTSGTIQWQKNLGSNGANSYGYSVAVDSSGNVYVCGYEDSSPYKLFTIAKYNTSGTIQWKRNLSGSSTYNIGQSVAVDSSGNVYVCGYSDNSGNYDIQIAKYNTSGNIQWQRSLSGAASDYGYGVAVDSSGNVYICGSSSIGITSIQIAKYDTSGTIQWQRRLSGSGAAYSVAVDSSGNVYICGISAVSSTNSFQIAKYNTSGTIQWQRSLNSSGSDIAYSIAVDANSNFYVCGSLEIVSGSPDFLFAKLPVDGSLTGTYTVGGYSIAYAASSFTDSASSLTDAATSLTDAVSTLTDSVSTLTDAATSLTSSVTTL